MRDANQIYMANGLIRLAATRAFWPLLFVRLVVDLELSAFQLVFLGTVFEAAIFLGEIPTGVVADVYSRRLSVVISYVMGGAAFIMSGLVGGYSLLIVSQILVGLASTFRSGAETAWITDELGSAEAAEPMILRRGQWELLAGVAGMLAFAGLAALVSVSAAIVATGVLMTAWGLVLPFVMPERGFERSDTEGWAEFASTLALGWRQVRRVRALTIVAAVVFIGGLAKEVIDRLDVRRLVDMGLPEDLNPAVVVGVLVAIRLLLASALLSVARRRVRGQSVVPALGAMLAGTAVGIALLAHVELLAVAGLGLILQGGLQTATEPLVALWTNTFAPSSARATIHSFIGQGESIGEVLGGLALGTVAQVFTVPIAMTISLALFVVAALLSMSGRSEWSVGLTSME